MLGEVITVFIMALAVGMDAFSVSLGLGIYKIRIRHIFLIGIVVGFFHFVMPLLGVVTGNFISDRFGTFTFYIGGVLLVIVGLQMIVSSFQSQTTMFLPIGWGLILFSILVSLDSFSVGLSLGIFGVRLFAIVVSFACVTTFLTWSGMFIGRKIQNMLGVYAELFGGCIFVGFGCKLLFPLTMNMF